MNNPEAQQLPTSGTVESRLGKIELTNGYPSDATVKSIFDEIDFQRGCQAYLWALPLMAMPSGIRTAGRRPGVELVAMPQRQAVHAQPAHVCAEGGNSVR